ncbi:hypothetical protein HYY71_07455 [Candidatus Woesearchaeota archaeon]|nr:hypothetical protein [Candidatus Woesearchaeota archaeon]
MPISGFYERNKSPIIVATILIVSSIFLNLLIISNIIGRSAPWYYTPAELFVYHAGLSFLWLPLLLMKGIDIYHFNAVIILLFLFLFIVSIVYIFYISKLIIWLKLRLSKKLWISLIIVILFLLFGFDFKIAELVDNPDVSCSVDSDCVGDYNQYSGNWCSYLCHNKNWYYYRPLISRAYATKPCAGPPSCKCVQNECKIDYTKNY